mmetsp:Transcript_119347/g.283325  ORF Transcript_119347/g.283325 Transcript_119347/m.283325 type:complete len:310 (+) Transcript_119347:378-1307(+)
MAQNTSPEGSRISGSRPALSKSMSVRTEASGSLSNIWRKMPHCGPEPDSFTMMWLSGDPSKSTTLKESSCLSSVRTSRTAKTNSIPSGTTRHGHRVSSSSEERGDQLNMAPASPPTWLGRFGGGKDVAEAARTETELYGCAAPGGGYGPSTRTPGSGPVRGGAARRPAEASCSAVGAGQRVTGRFVSSTFGRGTGAALQKAIANVSAMIVVSRPRIKMAGSGTLFREIKPTCVCKRFHECFRCRHSRTCAPTGTGASSSTTSLDSGTGSFSEICSKDCIFGMGASSKYTSSLSAPIKSVGLLCLLGSNL